LCVRKNGEWFGSAKQQTAKGRKPVKGREEEEEEAEDGNVDGRARKSVLPLLSFSPLHSDCHCLIFHLKLYFSVIINSFKKKKYSG